MAYLSTIQPSSLFSLPTPPMAARKHVSPLSNIPFQHLQKCPNLNPVHRSLINLNPKFRVLRLRSSSTTARPFSTTSESDHRPHWAADYRRRLGIHDARVIPHPPFVPWRAPMDGEIKINFYASLAKGHGDDVLAVTAAAYNSSGDVLGVTSGLMMYNHGNKLVNQLFALKAAANLAKKLKSMGTHDGPVVYESPYLLVTRCFGDDCPGKPEGELPPDEDLEEVGQLCLIYCPKSDQHPHWTTEYRRRLGIHDARVILQPFFTNWRPPMDGVIKINIFASVPQQCYDANEDETESKRYHVGPILAVARNSSGDVLGVTAGFKKHKHELELELCALKASANLAKALNRTGMHDGPVVYETRSILVTRCFHDDCEGKLEGILRRNMPLDEASEDFGRLFPVYCGSGDGLREKLPLSTLFLLEERDKALAGII